MRDTYSVSKSSKKRMGMADLLRYVVIGEVCLIAGWALLVMQEARSFRAPSIHIWTVALSYLMLGAGWCFELYARLGEPFSWRIIFGLIAGTFGLVAMGRMYWWYKPERRELRHNKVTEDAAVALVEAVVKEKNEE